MTSTCTPPTDPQMACADGVGMSAEPAPTITAVATSQVMRTHTPSPPRRARGHASIVAAGASSRGRTRPAGRDGGSDGRRATICQQATFTHRRSASAQYTGIAAGSGPQRPGVAVARDPRAKVGFSTISTEPLVRNCLTTSTIRPANSLTMSYIAGARYVGAHSVRSDRNRASQSEGSCDLSAHYEPATERALVNLRATPVNGSSNSRLWASSCSGVEKSPGATSTTSGYSGSPVIGIPSDAMCTRS